MLKFRLTIHAGLLLGVLLLLAFISGCASQPYIGYSGQTLPMNQVAVIEPEVGIEIHMVNAKVVDIKNETGNETGKYHSAVVLPGKYTLAVVPQYRSPVNTVVQLQVTVAADRKYLVRHKNVNRNINGEPVYEIWVEELVTRTVVSNRAISQNPFRPVDRRTLSTHHRTDGEH